MSYLIFAGTRYALPPGESTLGGADTVLAGSALAALPPFATVAQWPDRPTTIERATAATTVLLNGRPLGEAPRVLRHGARIAVAGRELLYGDARAAGGTAHFASVNDADLALLAALAPGAPTGSVGGRLVPLGRGDPVAVPPGGLVIGRDPACGLVLTSRGVSRRHASVRPGPAGYTLVDESANGVLVNGTRVGGSQLLRMGDLVRVGDDEFRFAAGAPAVRPAPAAAPHAAAARPAAPPRVLATLRVIAPDALRGQQFELTRPHARVGRAEHNDVRLGDASVSAAHATLAERGGVWRVLDLGSTNGSDVDGTAATRELTLPAACTVRFGDVEVLFRAAVSEQR